MHIRRRIVAFTTALMLVGGGALTACGDPVNSRTGTSKDTASNTSGANPSSTEQGKLPDTSDQKGSGGQNGGRNQ
jgi:hypothetical protein